MSSASRAPHHQQPPQWVLAHNLQQKNSSNVTPQVPCHLQPARLLPGHGGQLQAALESLAGDRGTPQQGWGQRGFSKKEHQIWRLVPGPDRQSGRG